MWLHIPSRYLYPLVGCSDYPGETMQRLLSLIITALLVLLLQGSEAQAKPKYLFKVATLAPTGSVWIEQFEKFSAKILADTGGEVGFRIYPGGVMGDDQAMLRKMRVGQLHGGGFTMTGVSNIQMIVFGSILIAIMLFEPLGIYGIWIRTKKYWKMWPY